MPFSAFMLVTYYAAKMKKGFDSGLLGTNRNVQYNTTLFEDSDSDESDN